MAQKKLLILSSLRQVGLVDFKLFDDEFLHFLHVSITHINQINT